MSDVRSPRESLYLVVNTVESLLLERRETRRQRVTDRCFHAKKTVEEGGFGGEGGLSLWVAADPRSCWNDSVR